MEAFEREVALSVSRGADEDIAENEEEWDDQPSEEALVSTKNLEKPGKNHEKTRFFTKKMPRNIINLSLFQIFWSKIRPKLEKNLL